MKFTVASQSQPEDFIARLLFEKEDKEENNIFFVGIGEKGKSTAEDIIRVGATIARKAKEKKKTTVSIEISEDVSVFNLTIGIILGNYSFTEYKKKTLEKEKKSLEAVTFVTSKSVQEEIARAEMIASAVLFARDLINKSPSQTPPAYLAEVAQQIAANKKDITCTVISKPEMETLGMGGLLSIARGSYEEPKFIHLTYKGGGKKVITIVGKGITFDTGGLSLKTAGGMETMKLDLSGGALVLAVFSIISQLHPEITLHGLIPATENMPGPHAIKPGDVATAMNGKTMEILNTDAEGRVVLADAMSYAEKNIKSDVIIDFATLTGACMIALGEEVAGLFSNNETLTKDLQRSAKNAGEKIWELPLVDGYNKLLKSEVADIKNIGGKYGGAITGALFIQAFVPENTPWAHLDIAGPAFAEKGNVLCSHGGTGFGIRLLIDYLLNQ